ncbi:MAG TPA: general stress protein [Nocardioides sp.]
MSNRVPPAAAGRLSLEFPQSLAVYDDYAAAQRTVDFLSDAEFPVQNCMIVGTDLKQVERVTGRLTYPKVAAAGAASGAWLGLFLGLIFSFFVDQSLAAILLSTVLLGVAFSVVWAVLGYAATGGRRDFSSVSSVVATRYEVLVEHKHSARARELLAGLPGALPNPFA